jgi:hypothetical protein
MAWFGFWIALGIYFSCNEVACAIKDGNLKDDIDLEARAIRIERMRKRLLDQYSTTPIGGDFRQLSAYVEQEVNYIFSEWPAD